MSLSLHLHLANLATCRPDSKPPGFGRTLLARAPDSADARALMERIRRAWNVVASWGRWSDEELGEWPPAEECLRQLPARLQGTWKRQPLFEVENWLNDLHDRGWIWWSSAAIGRLLKIDLSLDSLPASIWMIEFVIEAAGAAVFYQGDWLPTSEAVSHRAGSA